VVVGSLISVVAAGSGYLKMLESKNCQVWVFEKKIQNQRTIRSGYLKNLKELSSFMKDVVKTKQFLRQLFNFSRKIDNHDDT
jgi:hypothetical protein